MLWTDVERGGPEQAGEHAQGRTLLLVWPPYSTAMTYDCAVAYHAAGGERIVYVGEGPGGCTGDAGFHLLLGADCYAYGDDHDHERDDPQSQWREVAEVTIPQWQGIHDYLTVYERADRTRE